MTSASYTGSGLDMSSCSAITLYLATHTYPLVSFPFFMWGTEKLGKTFKSNHLLVRVLCQKEFTKDVVSCFCCPSRSVDLLDLTFAISIFATVISKLVFNYKLPVLTYQLYMWANINRVRVHPNKSSLFKQLLTRSCFRDLSRSIKSCKTYFLIDFVTIAGMQWVKWV